MATLHITGVSAEMLARLESRAAAKQQSLEAYLRDLIEREASVAAVETAAARRWASSDRVRDEFAARSGALCELDVGGQEGDPAPLRQRDV